MRFQRSLCGSRMFAANLLKVLRSLAKVSNRPLDRALPGNHRDDLFDHGFSHLTLTMPLKSYGTTIVWTLPALMPSAMSDSDLAFM